MSRILIVEDETIIRAALRRLLEKNDFNVDDAASVDEATSRFKLDDFNLIISDLRLPGAPGTDLISLAKSVPVLIMTSYASLRSAVDAMKLGAVDYIAKPFDHDEMLLSVRKIIENNTTNGTQAPRVESDNGSTDQTQIFGSCSSMQELAKRITKVARTNATVLIQGESGTGKELAARSIHEQSTRAHIPMISVNCAAIPESLIESELFGHEKGAFTGANTGRSGLLEAADGGTLFLDEIGELPLEAQARLLRFLQEGEIRRVGSVHSKKVDVRLIAATHRNLKELAKQNNFREDLYYRLYVMELRIPPLRERGSDILEIADKMLANACQRMNTAESHFSHEARQAMRTYRWPGNVRELENAIERAVILAEGTVITLEDLGLDIPKTSLDELETQFAARTPEPDLSLSTEEQANLSLDDYFQRFVIENQDKLSETELAKKLGVSRKCLWERRQKLGIPRKARK
ncbi:MULTISPECIES: sigma-54 dependent transcriptional regulator [unclassified Neptuniibacter]|jgi:DNA-binding NtrC family response regulator|uniref:sigma-54-dependent transcriptional regulator n=1 Tax=unclassified Neptuniibacter TaxID=2630693 RepID=UPI0026E28E5B|nr:MULTISPECIES: sigma-54 dependent transcriptional regulator [unclassified Neptuniibacter]MDO6515228.1 sigma-54 dependent transcriptional regulator [Neptuniibacter sp. 2_MG-2023]MDO6594995.1 sigma-54 dependent transcriptional regulator [Neptuniibacter sp. 1_MG-2023]